MNVELQPKQQYLLDLLEATGPEAATILGMGGSRGSAKSAAARRIAIILATTYPGIVIFLVRRVLGDLLENHMEKIKLEFPEIHDYYRMSDYEYALPNKSRIVYIYAETKGDVERVSYGPECTFLFIDQAEQFSDDELTSFKICNRYTKSDPPMPPNFAKMCLFFNVGVGIGAGWLRRVFHLRQFKPNEVPADYNFVQCYGWDNYEWFRGQVEISRDDFYDLTSEERFGVFITKTSEGRKMNALPEHRRGGELLGDFNSFSGQYFSDVWGEHCKLTPAQIDTIVQPWWVCWMAQDWGFGDHDFHVWLVTGKLTPRQWHDIFANLPDWAECRSSIEIAIAYRELLSVGRAEYDLASDIVRSTPVGERTQIKDFFLSQDAFGQKSKQSQSENTVGQTFSKEMERNGLPAPAPASQDRVNGWRFLYNCLRQSMLSIPKRIIDMETWEQRCQEGPALFFSVDCVACIDNMPLAVRDADDPNDVARVAGAVWEDVTDAIRYGMYSKLAPKKRAPVDVRAREVYAEAIAKSPTEAHLAMLHFKEREARRKHVGRARWR